jgi:hypothetical protein
VRKPTTPRSIAIALPAVVMLGTCNARRSASLSSGAWCFARGMPSAVITPMAKIADASRSTHAPLVSLRIAAAGSPPAIPAITLISARREFASTSSSSLSTTDGTSALFAIACDFESTSVPNASGYRSRPLRLSAINRHSTARPAHATEIRIRRPPRVRSRNGPRNGAITANGAMVKRR